MVNFEPGKTEALVRLKGPGSRAARATIAEEGGVPFSGKVLKVSFTYKHMGSMQSAGTSLTPELRYRTATARDGLTKARGILKAGGGH